MSLHKIHALQNVQIRKQQRDDATTAYERALVYARQHGGLSWAEIGAALGITRASAREQVQRAEQRLKERGTLDRAVATFGTTRD